MHMQMSNTMSLQVVCLLTTSVIHSPITGTCSDVLGTFSATISKNTVKARSTDMPREIFSPASGGRQNTIIT